MNRNILLLGVAVGAAGFLAVCGEPSIDADLTDGSTLEPDTATSLPYRYVLILDQENPQTSSAAHTSGVDLYGAQLTKYGNTFDATAVESCGFGGGDNATATDCSQAVGPPDDACDPFVSEPSFVSLGGEYGFIILSFGETEPIEQGDLIVVDACGCTADPGMREENYDIYIGVSADRSDPHWVECARSVFCVAVCEVPELPSVRP
jgi:hypothetical protein